MANIFIKGKKDTIYLSNERAKKIKQRWLGDGIEKASGNEILDLGEWCGEYSQIKAIEMEKEIPVTEQREEFYLTEEEKKFIEEEKEKIRQMMKNW